MSSVSSSNSYPFDVVLSFAGEDRHLVEPVAEALKKLGVRIFYDNYEQSELWGKDLYVHLIDIYRDQARFCVMFISEHYAQKRWTTHERRAAQARAFQEMESEYILPVRIDDTTIPGLHDTVGYINIKDFTALEIAELIKKKLQKPNP